MGYSLIYTPVLHFDDINGRPLVGGKLYTYAAGTSTPATTFRDKDGHEANTNPILLNERGECVVWLNDKRSYKFVLKDSLNNTIWEQDNVSIPAGEGGGPSPSEDILWGHWENKDTWKNIGQYTSSVEMAQYMTRSEGELGREGRPYLIPGLYDYKLELAFNMWGETDAKEFRTYNLNIKYGNDALREMAFNFRADTTESYMLTEWACGVFKMQEEGYIDINVWKVMGGNENHRLKVSHLFVHRID